MAAEFVSRLTKDFERPGLPAIALTTDSSVLTAFANDCGFDGTSERTAAPADTQHIQETHLAIEHLVCWLVERELFPARTPSMAGR